MKRAERPFSQLPRPLLLVVFALLLAQGMLYQITNYPLTNYQNTHSKNEIAYKPLSAPFAASTYRSLAMGSDRLLSYLLAIRLQLQDNQSGKHVRYDHMDYRLLAIWLNQINQLNPRSQYPIMLASRVYSQTSDKLRLRVMVDYIRNVFVQNPKLHWRRLTEATILARHQLGDLELALSMAQQLSKQPASIVMPHWARDMQFLLLGELNEFEAGIEIIAALLKDNSIIDPDERRFLNAKLMGFRQKLLESKR
jgi:hypothetical protein